jgi:hypothetical protein
VQTPELLHDTKLRVLPLSGFPAYRSESSGAGDCEIAQVFVDELADRAKRIFGKVEEIRD